MNSHEIVPRTLALECPEHVAHYPSTRPCASSWSWSDLGHNWQVI
jgi:hypothetical protein